MEFSSITLQKSCVCGLIILTTLCLCESLKAHYCDSSNDGQYLETEKECPTSGARSLPRFDIGWGHPKRAWLTLPPELVVKNSAMPKAGLGVFSKTFIPAYTWLGKYEGELLTLNLTERFDYGWVSICGGKPRHVIDGKDISRSNWLRWVNCPRIPQEENIKLRKCYGSIFYMTSRLILPGEELMIYYGDLYAQRLGINIERFKHNWINILKLRIQRMNVGIIMKSLGLSKAEAIKALKRNDNDMEKTMMDLVLGDLKDFNVTEHIPDKFMY